MVAWMALEISKSVGPLDLNFYASVWEENGIAYSFHQVRRSGFTISKC